MDEVKSSNDLIGFIENQKTYTEFREYMKALLSTFMPEEYLKIYMSTEMLPRANRKHVTKGFPETEEIPAKGPFAIIERAFTHEFVTTTNLESLETLGDGILNESVVMIIVGNWPNLLRQAGQVANMKKYHTNNIQIAKYADQMGFIRWVVRDRKAGLNGKERADIFESFIGALALIGEFYIGEQMGLAIARLFLNKFFAQQEWHPEDPEFYEGPENLVNDWKTSLMGRPPKLETHFHEDEDGIWTFTLTAYDQESAGKGPIETRIGKKRLSYTHKARSKDDAKAPCYRQLAEELKLSREDISKERRAKQEANVLLKAQVERLEQYAASLAVPRELKIPARKTRGGNTYVFIKEVKKEQLGERMITYEATVASGWASGENAEVDAMKMAVDNLITGNEWHAISGTDETYNPDEIKTTVKVSTLPSKSGPEGGDKSFRPKSGPRPDRGDKSFKSKSGPRPDRGDRPQSTGRGRGRGRGSTPAFEPRSEDYSNW